MGTGRCTPGAFLGRFGINRGMETRLRPPVEGASRRQQLSSGIVETTLFSHGFEGSSVRRWVKADEEEIDPLIVRIVLEVILLQIEAFVKVSGQEVDRFC